MNDYVMDPAEYLRTVEKARDDARGKTFNLPFAVVNGSHQDKLRKAAFNKAYEDAHAGRFSEQPIDDEKREEETKTLSQLYEEKFGKKPHWNMKKETIEAALEE